MKAIYIIGGVVLIGGLVAGGYFYLESQKSAKAKGKKQPPLTPAQQQDKTPPAPAPTPPAGEKTAASKQPNDGFPLKIGSQGFGVGILQAAKNIGDNAGLAIDGKLGEISGEAFGIIGFFSASPISETDFRNMSVAAWQDSNLTKYDFSSQVQTAVFNALVNTFVYGTPGEAGNTFYYFYDIFADAIDKA